MDVVARGVDVSSNNGGGTGAVNWQAVKAAGYSFAMVRIGYGMQSATGHGTYISKSYEPQMQGAAAAGLDRGVYWYSTAATPEQAREEAHTVLAAIRPYKLPYPVAFDFEWPQVIGGVDSAGNRYTGLPKGEQLDIIDAFMRPLEAAGYYAVLYMSASPLAALRSYAPARIDRYDCWVAQYAAKCTYPGVYGMWQHHGDARGFVGTIPGVAGPIDLNDCYQDYPTLMRRAGKNGYGVDTAPETPQEPPAGETMTITVSELTALRDALAAALEAVDKLAAGR